jgi:hypothetical protein
MSAPSVSTFIMKRPWLKNWMMPVAKWYKNAAGYRQLGLKFVTIALEQIKHLHCFIIYCFYLLTIALELMI